MRIVITGAGGFIGSHLSDALAEEHEVWGFDNFLTGRRENGLCTTLDILDRPALYALANKVQPELVIHCAASYSDPNLWHRDTDTNVSGAINAAIIAKHHDAKIVYFQTVLPPISSYAISKIAGEQYLRLCGQPLSVFRLASIFGPRNLTGPIPTFYKRISQGEALTVVRDVTRDFIFIDDVVAYVLRQIETDTYGDFDVGSGVETSIEYVAKLMGELLDSKPEINLIDKPAGDVPHYDMNPTAPEWMTTRLEDAIERTVRWYDEAGPFDAHTHLKLEGSRAS